MTVWAVGKSWSRTFLVILAICHGNAFHCLVTLHHLSLIIRTSCLIMDTDEFPTSPPKRQRTASPEDQRTSPVFEQQIMGPNVSAIPGLTLCAPTVNGGTTAQDREEDSGSNALLDALMRQVEAESTPVAPVDPLLPSGKDGDCVSQNGRLEQLSETPSASTLEPTDRPAAGSPETKNKTTDGTGDATQGEGAHAVATNDPMDTTLDTNVQKAGEETQAATPQGGKATGESDHMEMTAGTTDAASQEVDIDGREQANRPQNAAAAGAGLGDAEGAISGPVTMTDSIPVNAPLVSGPDAEGPEWEIDSSPYEESSSDSDSSSDTTSSEDSDEDADGDYAMLDPEEQARILMQGDVGSDDEGSKPKDKGEAALLRTANEKVEEVIPKPDITITNDMPIEELGKVEVVVENTVVVKAKVSGEYQVLEPGSLLCLKDRSVVGVVADLIGRVEEPRYTIRFPGDKEIEDAGLHASGTTVFYVPQHSTFVFTQPLKGVKGSDASNFHDEEVGDDEMEFSDDEAEAEYKRRLKWKRQGRRDEPGRGRGAGRGGRGGKSANHWSSQAPHAKADGTTYGNRSSEMNYDDVAETGDDGYTPLARPTNLQEMMERNGPSEERNFIPQFLPPSPSRGGSGSDFSRGRGRGRGGHGGYRGGRGGRGGFQPQSYQQPPPGLTAPSVQPYIQLPNTPAIAPQTVPYTPATPSPMTPLPNLQYPFSGYQQAQSYSNVPPAFPNQFTSYNPQQTMLPPAPHLNPAFMSTFPQPYHQTNLPGQNSFTGQWSTSPALAQALQQRDAEERRKTYEKTG